ncbi:hypothetical protein ACTXT7_007391 [Hymenolepis weldensis]
MEHFIPGPLLLATVVEAWDPLMQMAVEVFYQYLVLTKLVKLLTRNALLMLPPTQDGADKRSLKQGFGLKSWFASPNPELN